MSKSNHSFTPPNIGKGMYLLLLLVLFAACAPKPTPTPTPPAIHVSDPQTAPPTILKELYICMVSEPEDLFLYSSPHFTATAVHHALYENLYTTLDYDYQAQGLEKLPNLDDGDATVNQVMVQAGETVVDANGRLTTLAIGTTLLDAEGVPFEFSGEPVALPQMVVDFTLKPMVWSDGTAVTAADSVFSYEVAAYYDAASQPITHTASYTAVDSHTVRWTGLPGWLDQTYFLNVWAPLPQHQLAHREMAGLANLFGPQPETPILSSGPFVMKEWIPGADILLEANPYYYRQSEELPRLTQIRVLFGPYGVGQLLSGLCDILTRDVVDASQLPFLLEAESAELMTNYTRVNPIFEHIAFGINSYGGYGDGNGRPDWFEDVRVRQAVAQCTDRQRMVEKILFGLSEVMHTYVPSGNPLYPEDLPQWTYDVAAANALLNEAGYLDTDGDGLRQDPTTGIPFEVTLDVPDSWEHEPIALIFQENMRECGISVTLNFVPPADMFADGPGGKLFGRHYDLAEYAWLTEMESPCAYWLSQNISGPVAEGFAGWDGVNNTGWGNDEFDAACRQAERAFRSSPEYVTAHQAAMRLFAEQLPTLPLFPRLEVAATAPYVRNFGLNPTQPSELWNLHELDMELPYDQAALASLEPEYFCAEVTEIPQDECEALVILFKEMKNYSWTRYYNWLNTPTPCAWVHVSCTENHVTGLFIQSREPGRIPAEIGNLTYLESLRLWWLDLSELPPEIGRLTNLTDLDLSSSSLTSLPPEIGNLTNLINLDLSSNSLSSLPPEIGNLANLVDLNLSGNGLKNVPPELWRLHNLATLDLTGNSLTELPEGIDQLTNLTDLSLRGNSLGSLPPDLWKLTNLTSLDLAVTGLTNLSPEVGKLISLETLSLEYNNLITLPREISNLTTLSSLDLSENKLSSLLPEIGQLTELEYLGLDENDLSSLPPEIGNLINLYRLSLSRNNFSSLPPEIGALTSLGWLYLENNNLNSLPPEIGNLISLRGLSLENNNLNSLPPEIGNLTNLRWLYLENNNLRSLPQEISNLTNLSSLYLEENPLTVLPQELCAAFPDDLWLRPPSLCNP